MKLIAKNWLNYIKADLEAAAILHQSTLNKKNQLAHLVIDYLALPSSSGKKSKNDHHCPKQRIAENS